VREGTQTADTDREGDRKGGRREREEGRKGGGGKEGGGKWKGGMEERWERN